MAIRISLAMWNKMSTEDKQLLLQQDVIFDDVTTKVEAKASKNKEVTSSDVKVGSKVDIQDYRPERWGKGAKGYTRLRKKYSYDKCKAEGYDYDEEIYTKASEEYEATFKESLKK